MAGPTAGILLPRPLADAEVAEIWTAIDRISTERENVYFWVKTTAPIGGNYAGEGRPFALEIQSPEQEFDPEDIQEMEAVLGFRPIQDLGIAAMVNSDEDHRILGELCLWLAERFGGIVDFGGNLPTPLPKALMERLNKLWWNHPDRKYGWADLRSSFEQMVKRMPGRLFERSSPRHEWPQHYADPLFMRAWLDHPSFRMVK